MSHPYKSQMRANAELDGIIVAIVKDGGTFDIDYLLLQMTARHAVSEASLRKRINRWVRVYSDVIVVEGNHVRSVAKKKKKEAKK